ncbi:MAG: hypothetical protein ACI84D_003545 [Thalassolituus oleivorans]|jgi:hypothetical protein
MSHLDDSIAAWRRPFEDSVIYGIDTIDELEDHFRSLVDKARIEGRGDAESIRLALSAVGPEHDLRDQYLLDWTDKRFFSRWWAAVGMESRNCPTPRAFRALRYASLSAGAFGAFFLVVLVLSWANGTYRPSLSLDSGLYPTQQGTEFYWTLGLGGLFNLIPFRSWTASLTDIARLIFATWTGTLAIHSVMLAAGIIPAASATNSLDPFLWMSVMLIGPLMWLWQLAWRKPDTALDEASECASGNLPA